MQAEARGKGSANPVFLGMEEECLLCSVMKMENQSMIRRRPVPDLLTLQLPEVRFRERHSCFARQNRSTKGGECELETVEPDLALRGKVG